MRKFRRVRRLLGSSEPPRHLRRAGGVTSEVLDREPAPPASPPPQPLPQRRPTRRVQRRPEAAAAGSPPSEDDHMLEIFAIMDYFRRDDEQAS